MLLLVGLAIPSAAETVGDRSVQLTAAVQNSPPRISLSWQPDANATGYTVYRKLRDASSWGVGAALPATATNHIDTTVSVGSAFEYRVVKTAVTPSTNYVGEGYLYSGIGVGFTDARGKALLIVERSVASPLAVELARLERDLVGDGWQVVRREVASTDSVAGVGNQIRADYNADPNRVKAVFLLGHVPVPYSGNLNPDGHPDHRGAWPADVFYGDVNGVWPDATVNNATAASPRNRNTPGDGKFDPDYIPTPIELMVGRVDLSNLPAFGQSEVELLRRYLQKDHAFRQRRVTVPSRAVIDDQFGVFGGEAFAVNGWRNFSPLCSRTEVVAADWLTTLVGRDHLLAYGCGSGSYTSAGGVVSTPDLAALDQRAVFTLLFGSYFGDWDSPDNLLRSVLASSPLTLASAWAGRPHWQLHHLGLGETLGFCARATQNNPNLYQANYGAQGVHVALLGDPTLRLHPVAPPTGFVIRTNTSGGLRLAWQPSPDPVVGYHVYRAATPAGPFARLTPGFGVTNEFVDPSGAGQTYLLRAVKLEVTPSGSYYNLSQGVFQDAVGSFGPATLSIERAADSATVTLSWPSRILGYRLESADGLLGSWSPVSSPLQTNLAGRILTSVPVSGAPRFFRLHQP